MGKRSVDSIDQSLKRRGIPRPSTSHRSKFTAIDLFCGCGGLSLGLRRANFEVLGAIEINPLAIETYSANHPHVAVWPKDITKVSATEVMRTLGLRSGQLDLLAGCPPCQGFSTMRTLNGRRAMRDERNKLINDFLRFVRVLRPKAVMMENVPRLREHSRFSTLCRKLRKLGYDVTSDVKNAADFGVPQRRRRLILLASRCGEVSFPRPLAKNRTVAMAIAGLPKPGNSGDPVHDLPEIRSENVKRRIASIPRDGGSRTDLPRSKQLPCHRSTDGFKDVYGRMAWNDVAPTITGGCFNPSKGRFLHPTQNRAITMREAAILQGFPRKYKFPNLSSKQAIALLIGNALPPQFITAHAKSIARTLQGARKR